MWACFTCIYSLASSMTLSEVGNQCLGLLEYGLHLHDALSTVSQTKHIDKACLHHTMSCCPPYATATQIVYIVRNVHVSLLSYLSLDSTGVRIVLYSMRYLL